VSSDVTAGRYRHFKGREYRVALVTRDVETEEPVVVYQALYGEFGPCVPSIADFTAQVSRDGYEGPWFVRIDGKDGGPGPCRDSSDGGRYRLGGSAQLVDATRVAEVSRASNPLMRCQAALQRDRNTPARTNRRNDGDGAPVASCINENVAATSFAFVAPNVDRPVGVHLHAAHQRQRDEHVQHELLRRPASAR
jgi:hypothetical protein